MTNGARVGNARSNGSPVSSRQQTTRTRPHRHTRPQVCVRNGPPSRNRKSGAGPSVSGAGAGVHCQFRGSRRPAGHRQHYCQRERRTVSVRSGAAQATRRRGQGAGRRPPCHRGSHLVDADHPGRTRSPRRHWCPESDNQQRVRGTFPPNDRSRRVGARRIRHARLRLREWLAEGSIPSLWCRHHGRPTMGAIRCHGSRRLPRRKRPPGPRNS